MKNIICIDLTQHNNERLIEVLTELGKLHNFIFNVENILKDKKDGFACIYINSDSGDCIAFTTKKDKDKIVYTKNFSEALKSIKPAILVKEPRNLNLDFILDKIGKYGIASLTKDEKDFLDDGSSSAISQTNQQNSFGERKKAKNEFDDFE